MAKKDQQIQEQVSAQVVQAPEADTIAEIRRARKEAAEAKKADKKGDLDQREEFRKFFAKINGKLQLERSMEQIIWIHFKAAGFAQKEKFEDGIKHFGYNI